MKSMFVTALALTLTLSPEEREQRFRVAQTVSLLYRRLVICGACFVSRPCRLPVGDTAGCQPALQLVAA